MWIVLDSHPYFMQLKVNTTHLFFTWFARVQT